MSRIWRVRLTDQAEMDFTTYSDDLTDLSYRSRGWFVNMLGTM